MIDHFQKHLHSGKVDPAGLTDADHRAMIALIYSSLIARAEQKRLSGGGGQSTLPVLFGDSA